MKSVILAAAFAALTVLPILARGESGMEADKANSSMSVMWWGSQNRHDRTIRAIELYMERNPGVEVTYEFAGWSDYWTKATTMAAGGRLPDIMQNGYAPISDWIDKGLIDPWDDSIEAGLIDLSDVPEAAVQGGRFDGLLYGFSLGMNSQCVVIDLDMFEAAGIDVPPRNWTWDDFEDIAERLYDNLGVYAISGLDGELVWKALYIANGEWIYSEDGRSLGYDDDSIYVDHLNMVRRLTDYGAYPSRDIVLAEHGRGYDIEQTPIVSGEGAMAIIWSNQITAMTSAAGEERRFFMTHLPRLRADGPAANFVKPALFFSRTAQSRNPEEAARFVNFITNDIEVNRILMAERGVPIANRIREDLAPKVDEFTRMAFDFVGRVTQDSSPIPPPETAGHRQIINNVFWNLFIDPVSFGEISVEEGVALLRREAEQILEAK